MSYHAWKRLLDITGAGILLALALPVWGIIALLVLLAQGRPVFFRQPRAGLHGAPFTMLKFRTMRAGRPPRFADKPVAKRLGDPRVTPLGRVLRATHLDELPQLLNVLRGEMSLVGPRPLPLEDLAQSGWLEHAPPLERARRLHWLEQRQSVLPGLTGLWQITPNPEADFENWIASDLAYIESPSLSCDLLILLKTPVAILRGRRAAHLHGEKDPVPLNHT